jgi:hypothetical protein
VQGVVQGDPDAAASLVFSAGCDGSRLPSKLNVAGPSPVARFWPHANQYYRTQNSKESSQIHVLRSALKPLKQLYGEMRARDLSPLALKAVRQAMIDAQYQGVTSLGRDNSIFALHSAYAPMVSTPLTFEVRVCPVVQADVVPV